MSCHMVDDMILLGDCAARGCQPLPVCKNLRDPAALAMPALFSTSVATCKSIVSLSMLLISMNSACMYLQFTNIYATWTGSPQQALSQVLGLARAWRTQPEQGRCIGGAITQHLQPVKAGPSLSTAEFSSLGSTCCLVSPTDSYCLSPEIPDTIASVCEQVVRDFCCYHSSREMYETVVGDSEETQ